jgi:hypothetical protein
MIQANLHSAAARQGLAAPGRNVLLILIARPVSPAELKAVVS